MVLGRPPPTVFKAKSASMYFLNTPAKATMMLSKYQFTSIMFGLGKFGLWVMKWSGLGERSGARGDGYSVLDYSMIDVCVNPVEKD